MSIHPACLPANPADTVAVIIVNYNGGQDLARAVASVLGQSRPADEVLVIDNGSGDGSMAALGMFDDPRLRLVWLGANTGFAAASNCAAAMVRTRWLAMLNCDAIADPDWIAAFLDGAARHPDARLFASTQIRMDRPHLLDGAGDVLSVTGMAWRGAYGRPLGDLPGEGDCFAACAAGAFVSRQCYLDLGGFADSFFCYLEDLDFAYRACLAGERCVFLPGARIAHRGGGCSGPGSRFPFRLSARNRLAFWLRNTPLLLALVTWPMLLAGLAAGVVQGARHGAGLAVLQGYVEALRQVAQTLDQRSRLMPPVLPPRALLRLLSWNPLAPLIRAPRVLAPRPARPSRSSSDDRARPVAMP